VSTARELSRQSTRDQAFKLLRRPICGDGPATTFLGAGLPGAGATIRETLVPDRAECDGGVVLLLRRGASADCIPAHLTMAFARLELSCWRSRRTQELLVASAQTGRASCALYHSRAPWRVARAVATAVPGPAFGVRFSSDRTDYRSRSVCDWRLACQLVWTGAPEHAQRFRRPGAPRRFGPSWAHTSALFHSGIL